MKFEFDPRKDTVNIAKHGISLADAVLLDWDLLLVGRDNREDYEEVRMVGYAPIGTRVFCEVKRYASQI